MKYFSFNFKVLVLLLICQLTLSSSCLARVVEAKGISEITGNKVAQARRTAIEEAKRQAVEKTVGTFIQSRTAVNNYLIAKDNIVSDTAGRISKYEIIQDAINDDLGVYEVVIKADVDLNQIIDEVQQIQKAFGWNRKPRVTIINNVDDLAVSSALESALSSLLLKEDFELFVHDDMVSAGFAVDIRAQKSQHNSSYQGVELKLNELFFSVRVHRVGDKQILAAADFTDSSPGTNSAKAYDRMIKSGLKKIWPGLKRQLINFWQDEQYQARNMYLNLSNIGDFDLISAFAKEVKQTLPGVKDAEIIKFSETQVKIKVLYRGYTEQMYDELSRSQLVNKFNLTLVDVKDNQITAKQV